MEVGDILFQDYARSLAFSFSYICLFFVLTLYKYEVMFGCGVLLVALSGPFYPLLYGLPYIFITWRVLIGLNVSTDQIMALPRIRNTVFYIAVTLSTALTVLGFPYAQLLNPLILINLFVAWELSRIGIHNQSQGGYMYYPTRDNFFLLLLICASLVFLYHRLGIEECIVIASVMFVIVLALLK